MTVRLPRTLAAVAIIFGLVALGTSPAATADEGTADEATAPVPILAYYYIWFDEPSWNRAKTDYPQLGRYASDDVEVMRQHVRWAQAAGIDGFIVSWKSTLKLDSRLEKLIEVAREESFKLAIIYQGLDFHRDPLPVERIAADIDHFLDVYAGDPVFELFDGPPVMIWSGTWKFTTEEIDLVTRTRGMRSGCEWANDRDPTCVQLLGTERNLKGVQRLAGLVDGNAYYWSSVNPDTFPGYPEKLNEMSAEVHEQGGLWIAPAAPGFDARLIGGTTVVERRDGETLRRQLDAAQGSAPDAIGLISWNEFSENSHVEPSEVHGTTALDVLADVAGGRPPALSDDPDSSQPDSPVPSTTIDALERVMALVFVAAAVLLGSFTIARRQRRTASQ